MRRLVVAWILFAAHLVSAQEILSDRIKGLRVTGKAEAGLPVVGLQSNPVTIEFDVNENSPPDLKIRALHCDRNWNVTKNAFLNNDVDNRSKEPLNYDRAPDGVQLYRHHYAVQIPGIAGINRFNHSGNYLIEILSEDGKELLARARMFVAENVINPSVRIGNRSLPSVTNPYNQVNKIEITVSLPKPENAGGQVYYPLFLKSVDVYRNRQLYRPWRIDVDVRNGNTFIDGFGTPKMKFLVDNVTPGNSYRRMDIRDVTEYPEGRVLRSASGADVTRFQQPPKSDRSGLSVLSTGTRYSDYVPFRFELAMEDRRYEEIYVVGDFNGWRPIPEYLMQYDESTKRYTLEVSIRRGEYDYQYVVGKDDWIALEGNDWRTKNVYSAIVYYFDDRLGGFDRIIGFAQRLSAGGDERRVD